MRFAIEKMRQWWVFPVVLFAWVAASLAQVIPPFATTQPAAYQRGYQDALNPPALVPDYIRGLDDGKTPFVAPAIPAAPVYVGARSVTVDNSIGSDAGDGSAVHPYATIARAVKDADVFHSANPFTLVAIAIDGTGVNYHDSISKNRSGYFLFTGIDKGHGFPVIDSSSPFLFLNSTSIHIANIRMSANQTAPQTQNQNGVFFNGCSDVSLDNCEAVGYGVGACFEGVSKLRVQGCWFAYSWMPLNFASPMNSRAQGIYTLGCSGQVVIDNKFYHIGWRDNDLNMADPRTYFAWMYSHGYYESADNGSGPSTCAFNLFWKCAASGHQQRPGGVSNWNIYAYNGNAVDAFGGGASWSLTDSVVLGNPPGLAPSNFAGWGGGVNGGAAKVNVQRVLFLGANTSYLPVGNPAVAIFPPAGQAMPAGATATVTDISGVWPNGIGLTNKGWNLTQANINVRAPRPGERVAGLLDYLAAAGLPAADDNSASEIIRQHRTEPRFSTPMMIDWFRRSAPR